MPESEPPILDTMILQGFSFGMPDGLDILLTGLGVPVVRFPEQIYNRDENSIPLGDDHSHLSELAQGIRYFKRKSLALPAREAVRYQTCLVNANQQLPRFLERGSLRIEQLDIQDLIKRDRLEQEEAIDPGEAACLALAHRSGGMAVFVSSDGAAGKVAEDLGVQLITTFDVLERWLQQTQPTLEDLERVLMGLTQARFGFKSSMAEALRSKIQY